MGEKTPKTSVNLKELEKAFEGDLDLILFYVTWVKHGLVAKFAYQELHPDVTPESAEVGGSRMLSRVKREYILSAYGLGPEKYFQQLKDGIDATKWNDFTGEREADHNARKPYHDKLGRLLGVENNTGTSVAVQVNNFIKQERDEFGI